MKGKKSHGAVMRWNALALQESSNGDALLTWIEQIPDIPALEDQVLLDTDFIEERLQYVFRANDLTFQIGLARMEIGRRRLHTHIRGLADHWPPLIFPPAKKHALVSEWSRPPRVFSRRTTKFTEAHDHGLV